ncbi:major facilitator superfamily domain-containing protein [Xylariaceae sp. FL0016]|nr:major facilitator superfamily domain-containing protein [Xylariaceae sp. FL0016]
MEDSVSGRGLGVFAMLRLTCGVFGLQLVFSVIMASGTPYLLLLGLSKSCTALVWLSGPLAGVVVQPIVGACSDRCEHAWGRRKPYMVGGAFFCVLSLLALPWVRESAHLVAAVLHLDPLGDAVKTVTMLGAVFWVYVLNISLNPIQACLRAFIIDNCPQHQQVDANAWAGRLTGIGNAVGYIMGMADLPALFPFLGDTQFRVQCSLASIALIVTIAICCLSISEGVPAEPINGEPLSIGAVLLQLYQSSRSLPPVTRRVCKVQFFAWMGWFPFLYYVSSYIGELYAKPILSRIISLPDSLDLQRALLLKASRVGVSGSFSFALISLGASIFAPLIVYPITRYTIELKHAPSRPLFKRISLVTLWKLSHVFFALCMFLTIFAQSELLARVFIGMSGASWALTTWAPFALISSEISRIESDRSRVVVQELDPHSEIKAGVVIGLHNVAIAAPQVLSALLCSLVLRILQGFAVDDVYGWLLRMAGVPALIAAYLLRHMEE